MNMELVRQKVAKLANDVQHLFKVLYGTPPDKNPDGTTRDAMPGFGHFLTDHHKRIDELEQTCAALLERNRTLEEALAQQFDMLSRPAAWLGRWSRNGPPPFHSTLQGVRAVRHHGQPSQGMNPSFGERQRHPQTPDHSTEADDALPRTQAPEALTQDAPACPSGPGPRSPSFASESPGSSSTTVDSLPTMTR